MSQPALMTTGIAGYPCRSGKVRDVYDLGDRLLLIATDRISAFDVIMANGIPDKGRVLTQISLFWFEQLAGVTKNHILSADPADLPAGADRDSLDGRFMICRKASVVPIECIVRGYLAGTGWKEYQKSGTVCGIHLPDGLKQCDELPEPIFTPSTKAEQGHDENISFDQACQFVGTGVMNQLKERSLAIYKFAKDYASRRGIILADTKFEWGRADDGEIILIDECLTPDSSRFWPADLYQPGQDQPSFDKQFVRDYLDQIGFDRNPPGPTLPPEIVSKTRQKYIEAYTKLTGKVFQWK
ncbi:MAG: phosphoribosylaminoimidazolesuccinocarboxamide synthase [Planctomycetaceae bacterium]|nr:MAG: phosphoribosylaminoimidazolesuccinocarboxamide synthase [Planctomycetaceae bacterium]